MSSVMNIIVFVIAASLVFSQKILEVLKVYYEMKHEQYKFKQAQKKSTSPHSNKVKGRRNHN